MRRVTAEGVEDLEFTRSQDIGSLCFAVTDDGSRIAWAGTTWTADGPKSQLWMADITGANQVLVAETRADDEISEWFVLEPVEWLEDGDLVYAWQVTGIGGYILFFGWSSLYRYAPSTGSTTPIAPATGEVGAPCWSDMTSDGAFAIGACAPSAGVEELEAATGLATQLPMFPNKDKPGPGPTRHRGLSWRTRSPGAMPPMRLGRWYFGASAARSRQASPPSPPAISSA